MSLSQIHRGCCPIGQIGGMAIQREVSSSAPALGTGKQKNTTRPALAIPPAINFRIPRKLPPLQTAGGVWRARVKTRADGPATRPLYSLGTTDNSLARRKLARVVALVEVGADPLDVAEPTKKGKR
jgi:hypothetical protein